MTVYDITHDEPTPRALVGDEVITIDPEQARFWAYAIQAVNAHAPMVAAIKAFNDAQTSGSYFEDRTRIALLASRSLPEEDNG